MSGYCVRVIKGARFFLIIPGHTVRVVNGRDNTLGVDLGHIWGHIEDFGDGLGTYWGRIGNGLGTDGDRLWTAWGQIGTI